MNRPRIQAHANKHMRLQNKQSIVVGLPDLSSNQQAHASGYVADASKLRSSGYEQILVSAVASPEEMEAFITAIGAQPDGSIAGLADSSGHFCRMLGLDLNSPATEAPFSQRFLGMVNDGMLTKLVRCVSYRGAAVQCSLMLWTVCLTQLCIVQCVEKAPELTEVSSSAAAVRTVQAMSFAE